MQVNLSPLTPLAPLAPLAVAVAAEPILASTLYEIHRNSRDGVDTPTAVISEAAGGDVDELSEAGKRCRKRRRLGTGCGSVDSALRGGLEYGGAGGGLVCVSAGDDGGGRAVSSSFLHFFSVPCCYVPCFSALFSCCLPFLDLGRWGLSSGCRPDVYAAILW